MQGDELAPGGKNILARGTGLRAPHRRGRDRPLNPLKSLRKSGRGEVGAHLLALLGWFRRGVMVGVPGNPRPPRGSNRPAAPGVNTPRGAKRRPDSLPKLPAAARYPPLP